MTPLPIFPLRVNFTHEDKAAKGLRTLREPSEGNQPPVYFTAREMVAMHERLVLLGGPGAGKTTLAQALQHELDATLIRVTGAGDLPEAPPGAGLVIIDGVERLGPDAEVILDAFVAEAGTRPLLLLADPEMIPLSALPPGFAVHTLLPLSREDCEAAVTGGAGLGVLSPVARQPGLFAAAATLTEAPATSEALADALTAADPGRPLAALVALDNDSSANRALDHPLAAQALAEMPVEETVRRFILAPEIWSPVLQSRLQRRPDQFFALAQAILGAEGRAGWLGALLLAPIAPDDAARLDISAKLATIIADGLLSPQHRDRAARFLSVWGDPRDLDAVCEVPGGSFTMGSESHPNSAPIHQVDVAPFRIGAYPVTNGQYARFVEATGRPWSSPEAHAPERLNAPATDLSWRDANAYCGWLTDQWRRDERIRADEIVRLATEPEWERAARGDQPAAGARPVYPWGLDWDRDACNWEGTGFNEKCAVGLFPKGRSPYGCWDMAGQVWEWTSTLWGDNMAHPHYTYPYCDDGRETAGAGPAIRRVLRGGCFSSTPVKVGAVYRGSLEPDGSWRGNGFRIVIGAAWQEGGPAGSI